MGEPSDAAESPSRERTLRIRLPVAYHMRLHRLKLYAGLNMAQVVREALDVHLEREEARLASRVDAPRDLRDGVSKEQDAADASVL